MAGVVAMASVIEDFEAQPCKKSRKDGDSPVVKTITNYFAPLPKSVEKPFSPPRPNNIMDYFSRNPGLSTEKTSTPEQAKENGLRLSGEKRTTPEGALKLLGKPSQRQGRLSKAARRLQKPEPGASTKEGNAVVVEELDNGRGSVRESVSSCGILGSDTAALLMKLSADAGMENSTDTASLQEDKKDEQCEESRGHGKTKPEMDCSGVSPIAPLKGKVKRTKPATRNPRKRQPQETKQSDPELKEIEQSLCDVSMEVNLDEASQVNNSTITISFEDFLQSQSLGEDEDEDGAEGSRVRSEAGDMEPDHVDIPKGDERLSPSELRHQQVSPRTLTIQAEVHAVSPRKEEVKPISNVASIFTKRKGVASPAEVASPPHLQQKQELPFASMKWKSNVVLQEQDLELAVVESESIPKCNRAERKQFMAAFKQPSLDGLRTKPTKAQAKQKAPAEKTSETGDKTFEDDVVIVSMEQPGVCMPEKRGAKNKLSRKGKKKSPKQEEEVVHPPPAAASKDQPVCLNNEAEVGTEEPSTTSATAIPTVRRSKREAVLRQSPKAIAVGSVQKTQSQETSKDATLSRDSPLRTPKTRKSKRAVFKSELICPADKKESPIRIKFTRVNRNVSISEDGSEFEILSPLATKSLRASTRRKQAQKLVEKAKVIQQSKKDSAEDKGSVRRSSRSQASIMTSYCEDEDSIICLEGDQGAAQLAAEGKSQKGLRSLNDVLGKTTASKDTKTSAACKVAPVLEKKAQRTSMMSVFDESSREGSENSQEDEQFRARREFLKSGLPESFKKQIARTTATKEAYAVSCSSFQPVVHILQIPQDCPLWNLPWPESAFLCQVKHFCGPSANPLASLEGSLCCKTEPAAQAFCHRGSGSRKALSEGVRNLLVKEVSVSNPAFPVQRFITRFLRRRADFLQQSTTSETEAGTKAASMLVSAKLVAGKRKRTDEEDMTGKVAKKRRSSHSEKETTTSPEPTKRRGRMSRSQRRKLEEEEEKAKRAVEATPLSSQDDSVLVMDNSPLGGKTEYEDIVMEDVLWTEKYQPQHPSDVIGNTSSVRRLHSWLKEWKLRTDREERKRQKEKKQEEGSNNSDWDCGEDTQDGEDFLCNTLLITGPTGVGKTAAVYACAQELGFKVFEVNASSQRSGRLILSQLKEATQSHQVDIQGANALKPTYFNSYSSAGSSRPGSSPRKVNSPRRVVSSPRKHPQSPKHAKRGSLAPTSLANFFKMGLPPNKDVASKTQRTVVPKKMVKGTKEVSSISKECALKTTPVTISPKESLCEEQIKKTATSLILFEEVDVIFDDDCGFLAAIKTFMTTTKRPVILTTSDPTFSTMFDGNFEEFHFQTPSILNVSSYLQLLCLTEDIRTDSQDISSLLSHNSCDIRQSLLQLQFWTRSTGGRQITKPLLLSDNSATNAEVKPETPAETKDTSECAVTVPACDTGCTESMLGLLNCEPEGDMQALFKGPEKQAVWWQVLTDSRRRGVALLYSNMEALLPLPVTELPVSRAHGQPHTAPKELPSALPSGVTSLPGVRVSAADSDDGSPVKVSGRMRRLKKRHCLPDQDPFRSDSDSEDDFLSLCKPQSVPRASGEKGAARGRESPAYRVGTEPTTAPGRLKREPLTPQQRLKSAPVARCLDSIADFLDHMSYLDSHTHLCSSPALGNTHRTVFFPDSAHLKDGMVDEPRVEPARATWAERERALEIQAAVESLSFQRCRKGVAEAWAKAQTLEGELGREATEELTLPVAPHRHHFSLTSNSLCQPGLHQQRREVMEDLLSQGALGAPGNRPAAALDYLPTLRTICRSEQLKEQGKVKRRFLHYLDSIHIGLPKSTLQQLAKD